MELYKLKTTIGNFDYEVIIKGNIEYVATISKSNGNRYLKPSEVPTPIMNLLKKQNYKIDLLDADELNKQLGLCK